MLITNFSSAIRVSEMVRVRFRIRVRIGARVRITVEYHYINRGVHTYGGLGLWLGLWLGLGR